MVLTPTSCYNGIKTGNELALYDESGGIENTGIRRQVIKEITDFAKKYDVKKFFSSDQGKR